MRRNGGRGKRRRGRRGLGARPQDPESEWSRTHNPPAVRPFTEPSPGPTQRYENGADTREGAYFEQIFIDEMLDMAIRETDTVTNEQQLSLTNIKGIGIQLPKTR